MNRHSLPLYILALSSMFVACSDSDTGGPGPAQGIDVSTDVTTSDSASSDTGSADAVQTPDILEEDVPPNAFAYLVVEPAALAFGEWPLGSVETRELEIENAGMKSLTLNSISLIDGSGEALLRLCGPFSGRGVERRKVAAGNELQVRC